MHVFFAGCERFVPLLYGSNGQFGGFEIGDEPFLSALIDVFELLSLNAAALQHFVYVFVVEPDGARTATIRGCFGVKQFVGYAGCSGVLIDTIACGLVEHLTVGRYGGDVNLVGVDIDGGFAYFQAIAVCFVADAKHINQLGFQFFEIFNFHA